MRYASISVGLLATLLLLHFGQAILVPLLLAMLMAQLLVPVVSRLEHVVPRSLAILISLGLVATVVGALVSILSDQIGALREHGPELQQRILGTMEALQRFASSRLGIEPARQIDLLKSGLESMLGAGSQVAVTALSATVGVLTAGILELIFVFLMLYYRDHFRKHLVALLPSPPLGKASNAVDSILELGQKYVAGLLTVIGIIGALDTLGMLLVRAPYPALFGLLGGLSVLIPYVGIIVVAPLCTFLAWLATGKVLAAVLVLAVFAVIHMLEGNVVTPYLIGHQVNLNPLTSILAVLIGGELWGPAGMLLFIPLIGMLELNLKLWPATKPWAALMGNAEPPPTSKKTALLWRLLRGG